MKNFTRREVLIRLAAGAVGASMPVKVAFGGNKDQNWLLSLDASGSQIDGEGATILVSKPLTLRAGHFSNIAFSPAKGYSGPGPIFMARDGFVIHDNVQVTGFTGPGCKILSIKERGNSFIAIGKCSYSNNGALKRTELTASADLRFVSSVSVKDASLFNSGDYIWIGDGKFKIDNISGDKINLVRGDLPNIISPKVFSGAYDKCSLGQFVTIDSDDKNGIRIGDGGYSWNIDTSQAEIECSNNAWFGMFHYCKKYFGKQLVENITSIGNGYCNIGMGYMNSGTIKNCISRDAGNNCIDIFESRSDVDVTGNIVSGAGVDGIFVGGNGETARVYDNQVTDCRRIGVLINARKNPIQLVFVKNNIIKNMGMNSLTLTGVEGGVVESNTLDGSCLRQAIYLEQRKGLALSGELIIRDNFISNSVLGDISTNYPSYGKNNKAKIMIQSTKRLAITGIEGY
ncbi:TPA: right-handed parallel beta-helix repeat-containing protein [Klebsiella oxytoca]|nr:right-handed parallel beta-helix repeat-containing protein [Klebsiella oxytoca]